MIRDVALGGVGQITANFTIGEAQRIAAKLKPRTCG